jgi:hypothetical protein
LKLIEPMAMLDLILSLSPFVFFTKLDSSLVWLSFPLKLLRLRLNFLKGENDELIVIDFLLLSTTFTGPTT